MTIAEEVAQKLDVLPADQQRAVLAFVDRLRDMAGSVSHRVYPSLHGILSDPGAQASFEDFQEARREMWGSATDEELS